MKRLYLTLVFCLALSLTIRAQYIAKANQFFIEISLGNLHSLSPNLQLSPDIRLRENQRNDCVLNLNMKYFWHKAWGVQTRFAINTAMEDNSYYTEMANDDGKISTFRGEMWYNLSAGLVYRWDTPRWSIQPYINAGLSFFSNANYIGYFKHLGTNDVDLLTLDMGKGRKGFALTPGVQMTWKVKSIVAIFAEVSYMANLHSSYGYFEKQNVYTLKAERYPVKERHGDNLLLMLGCSFRIF